MACNINRERRRTDDAWLSNLACHERGMRGSAPDSRHNSRGDGESRDIRRAGIRAEPESPGRRWLPDVRRSQNQRPRRPTAIPADAPVPRATGS